jgi:hypothetical protein
VAGIPASIDRDGIHLATLGTGTAGITAQQASAVLNGVLAADGISIRLADPSTTVKGAEAVADSGGLVVSSSRQIYVPVVPGVPNIPVPVLGNQGLPAGTYTVTSQITLGSAATDVSAAVAPSFVDGATAAASGTLLPDGGAPTDTGTLPDSGALPAVGFGGGGTVATTIAPTGPGTTASTTSPVTPGLVASLGRLPGLGLPVPVGWVVLGLLLCLLCAYPLLLAARWQFLGRRR